MLTVGIKGGTELESWRCEVEISWDDEGLEELLHQLAYLKRGESHVDIMTEAWARNEFNKEVQGPGNALVNHLYVMRKLA